MKIIKKGNLTKEVRFECPDCGCIFIADKGEWTYPGYRDDQDADYICTCPTCKMVVSAKKGSEIEESNTRGLVSRIDGCSPRTYNF